MIGHYEKEKGEKSEARIENLEELVNAASQFDIEDTIENPEGSPLEQFLAHAALEAGDAQADTFEDSVQLMTLHSAKGLEFKLVFLVGLEEGLFPSQQSLEEENRLEEERRLCYVGMTRAMEQLFVTHAESRRLYGRESHPRVSRFVREIPREQLQEVRVRATIKRPISASIPASSLIASSSGFPLGQRVFHSKYGEGIVLQNEGEGGRAQVQVNFENAGSKWLMVAYANLKVM